MRSNLSALIASGSKVHLLCTSIWGLGDDPGLVDEIVAGTKHGVEFLGDHRELISMAHQAYHAQLDGETSPSNRLVPA